MLRVACQENILRPVRQGLAPRGFGGADGAPLITLCPAGGQREAERGGMFAQVVA